MESTLADIFKKKKNFFMNILDLKLKNEYFLNEFYGFSFELDIELNLFLAPVKEKLNIHNTSVECEGGLFNAKKNSNCFSTFILHTLSLKV